MAHNRQGAYDHRGGPTRTNDEQQAFLADVERLRAIMTEVHGVTDTPTHLPHEGLKKYRIAARSTLTRRAMLEQMPPRWRAFREAEYAALGESAQELLAEHDVVEVVLHSYIDRGHAAWPYDRWLMDQVHTRIPEGYAPEGAWEPAPMQRVIDAWAAWRDRVEVKERLREAVRAAMERGISGPRIAKQLGVAPARVYQLRDGRG